MNITEANAANYLLAHLLGRPYQDGTPVPPQHAREAAMRLADRAHLALHAGLRGEDVDAAWPAWVGEHGLSPDAAALRLLADRIENAVGSTLNRGEKILDAQVILRTLADALADISGAVTMLAENAIGAIECEKSHEITEVFGEIERISSGVHSLADLADLAERES